MLIKQTSEFSAADSIESLIEADVVDAGLPAMLPVGVELYLAGPHDAATAGKLLSSGRLPGTRITHNASLARRAG